MEDEVEPPDMAAEAPSTTVATHGGKLDLKLRE
jgi:hypothetical protein